MATTRARHDERVTADSFCKDSRLARQLAHEAALALGFTRPDAATEFVATYEGPNNRLRSLRSLLLPSESGGEVDHCFDTYNSLVNSYMPASASASSSAASSSAASAATASSAIDGEGHDLWRFKIDKFPTVYVAASVPRAFGEMGLGTLAGPETGFGSVGRWEAEFTHCRALGVQMGSLIAFANGILGYAATTDYRPEACALMSALRDQEPVPGDSNIVLSDAVGSVGQFASELTSFYIQLVDSPVEWTLVLEWAKCVADRSSGASGAGVPVEAVRGAHAMYTLGLGPGAAPSERTRPEDFDIRDPEMLVRWRWPGTFAKDQLAPVTITRNNAPIVPAGLDATDIHGRSRGRDRDELDRKVANAATPRPAIPVTTFTADTRPPNYIDVDHAWASAAIEANEIQRDERRADPGKLDDDLQKMRNDIGTVVKNDGMDATTLRAMMQVIKEHAVSMSNASFAVNAGVEGDATERAASYAPSDAPSDAPKRKGLKLFAALHESQEKQAMPTREVFRSVLAPSTSPFTGGMAHIGTRRIAQATSHMRRLFPWSRSQRI
jgi:hypothetical protein